ncbi:MAG: adenylate cyclase [Deltaproteobacteria bacterium]|nr:adenylate cyclase [Deltaproteobacteria bacterium]
MNPSHIWKVVSEYAGARWRFRRLRGAALAKYQERNAVAAAAFALAHSPFWRRHAGSLPPERWREFPVIDKAIMMANFAELNIHGVTADEALAVALKSEETRDFSTTVRGLTVVLSSGTSGHRTISLVSPDEQSRFVGLILARMLDGLPLWRRHRVAFFLRSNSNMYEATRSPLIDFRYFDLTLTRAEIIERLQALQPDILVGPPALLGVVADVVEEGLLTIRPTFVLSGAEVLEPQVKARLERLFGTTVRDIYHTSEGPLGVTCRAGRMHLQEDVAVVELEPLGAQRFTPVMTQLFRRAQPLLRYRMNDVVVVGDEQCPCGSAFRVVTSVEGRCDDIFYLERLDGSLKLVFPDQVRRAVLETEGVIDYRVEQHSFSSIGVYVAGAVDVDALQRVMLARIADATTVAPVITITKGISAESDRRRKLVRVRRSFTLLAEDRARVT